MINKPLPELNYRPPQAPLCIIHKDEHLLALSKPPGLLSVPGKDPAHHDSLENRAKTVFPEALLVHRLDMETSGVFVMAINRAAQANLGKQFERRKITKTYLAEVWGDVRQSQGQNSGVIDLPLICDWPNRPLQKVCHETGKTAQTRWEALETRERSTLMKLEPLTGRSHQLRVHMLALNAKNGGHPILGDTFYAHDEALSAAPRLMLHALELELHHPEDGERITFKDMLKF